MWQKLSELCQSCGLQTPGTRRARSYIRARSGSPHHTSRCSSTCPGRSHITPLAHPFLLVPQIVYQQILAKGIGIRVEGAATVHVRHLVDEVLEVRVIPEHEDVHQHA